MKSFINIDRVYDIPYDVAPSNQNHDHVDLKLHPDEIGKLPELFGRPELRELVVVLNRGPFMTHGCAFGLAKPYQPDGDVPISDESKRAPQWCTSYVTFSFWQFSQNEPENFLAIYDKLTASANGIEVCFVIQRACFLTLFERMYGSKYEEMNGTVCLVWISGFGETPDIAYDRWRNATRTLTAFFSTLEKSGGIEQANRFDCLSAHAHNGS